MPTIKQSSYQTRGGIQVRRTSLLCDYETAMQNLASELDSRRGVLLSSSFEYPGRYTRWDIGFVNPPVQIVCAGRALRVEALNHRGEILLPSIHAALESNEDLEIIAAGNRKLELRVRSGNEEFAEEQRSRQPSVFSALRSLSDYFYSECEAYLGLYGAFGYDLGFQFEDVERCLERKDGHRDLVLYLPDEVLVADHRSEECVRHSYEFVCRSWDCETATETTGGFRRTGTATGYSPAISAAQGGDHAEGEYADIVRKAREEFRSGNLFEVVPGQVFFEPCRDRPSAVFARLKKNNPAPYGALINLGEQEYLVAASPEMFVRVDGRKIETCPISGTIRRGADPIEDAEQIRKLLNSAKDESELSMCTDVDRNDKARICEPGSVSVVGRRQIELYSRLIHTVDHVSGTLSPDYDALDGFLAHTWAVTVTGAPKHAAMQFIERHEKSPRHWYGGAIGFVGFNGNLNTGLTLRTIRIKSGVAEVRAGATLLIDSDPDAEEEETRLKASALRDAIKGSRSGAGKPHGDNLENLRDRVLKQGGLKALMVDHEDSFVHNLAAYFRCCGVEVSTLRPEPARRALRRGAPDLVILSPGPGSPADHHINETLKLCSRFDVPVFGVCLGMQGMVEFCGGRLRQLDYPMHGKQSGIQVNGGLQFQGLPAQFNAGRYHSLYATEVPDCLRVVAQTQDGVPMAVEHQSLPWMAVQFHPESIMTLAQDVGQRLIVNVVEYAQRCKLKAATG